MIKSTIEKQMSLNRKQIYKQSYRLNFSPSLAQPDDKYKYVRYITMKYYYEILLKYYILIKLISQA